MNKRQWHSLHGEESVLISLAMSVGFVVLSFFAWWVWKTFPAIFMTITGATVIEMP